MVSFKGRAVVLGRNPPITKRMEKIEFIQFVIQIKAYFKDVRSLRVNIDRALIFGYEVWTVFTT